MDISFITSAQFVETPKLLGTPEEMCVCFSNSLENYSDQGSVE